MGNNLAKEKQLGMPFGTAQGQLRKLVLFDQKHGENVCFRCGKEITESQQLSVEHKEPWLNVNPILFWDMDNIAFSHLSCNCAHGERAEKGPIPHGSHFGIFLS